MSAHHKLKFNEQDGLWHGVSRKYGEFTVPPAAVHKQYWLMFESCLNRCATLTPGETDSVARAYAMRASIYTLRLGREGIALIARPAPEPEPAAQLTKDGERVEVQP